MRKHVKALEKERESYFAEAEDVMKQCTESMDEVELCVLKNDGHMLLVVVVVFVVVVVVVVVYNCCVQVKKKEMKIFELRKKIAEADKDLKQQQNLYEAARSDRNLYSKNLIEAQDEISEFKRKIKIMTHQVWN